MAVSSSALACEGTPAPRKPRGGNGRPAYDEAEADYVRSRRAAGADWAEIAAEIPGRTGAGLQRRFAAAEFEAMWTPARRAEAKRRYEAGEKAMAIAGALGDDIQYMHVAVLARREGWRVKRPAAAMPVTSATPGVDTVSTADAESGCDLRADPSPYAPLPVLRALPALPGKGQCEWPKGDPALAGFHYCGQPNAEGRCYCPEHLALSIRPLMSEQAL